MHSWTRGLGAVVLLLVTSSKAFGQLPAPTNPNLRHLGYYFVNERQGDFTSEVYPYTNLHVAIPDGYNTGNPDWQGPFYATLNKAVASGKAIYLHMKDVVVGQQVITSDQILDLARPFWDHVVYVDVAQEGEVVSSVQLEARIDEIRAKLAARGMPFKPFGATFKEGDVLTNTGLFAPSLSFAAIEAYLPPPGDPDPNVNVASLNSFLDQAKDRVRAAGKSAVLIMQGYDRNFTWTNINTLTALQAPVYLKAYNDPIVTAITIFAYARGGGSRDHQELQAPHRDIAAAMGLTGRFKIGADGSCYWDPYDSGPNQCSPALGRWKLAGDGTCYFDPNDSGPDQCVPLSDPAMTATATRMLVERNPVALLADGVRSNQRRDRVGRQLSR